MADPNMKWYDPHTWLFCLCGIIGLILGGILCLILLPLSWFMSWFGRKD
jgi:hypothetical protein